MQLIDAQSGSHLWADRFEVQAVDTFDLQDRILARLVPRLRRELINAEAQKAARAKTPDAIDLALRGQAIMLGTRRPTPEENDAAISLFEQALKLDPDEPDALAGLALAYGRRQGFRWSAWNVDEINKLLAFVDRAAQLDPKNSVIYRAKINYLRALCWTQPESDCRWNEMIRVANAGLSIDRYSAVFHAARGFAEGQVGRYEESAADTQKAKRLNSGSVGPRHRLAGVIQGECTPKFAFPRSSQSPVRPSALRRSERHLPARARR